MAIPVKPQPDREASLFGNIVSDSVVAALPSGGFQIGYTDDSTADAAVRFVFFGVIGDTFVNGSVASSATVKEEQQDLATLEHGAGTARVWKETNTSTGAVDIYA